MPVREIQSEKQYANHSAVARHSAFPNTEDRQRLAQHFGLVEENVAETPADDHAKQRAASDEVAHSLRRQISKAALSKPQKKEIAGNKSEHVSQAVPPGANIVGDPKNNWIEIVQIIREHCADCP